MFRDPFETDFTEVLQLEKLGYSRSEKTLYRKLTDCILKGEERLFLKKYKGVYHSRQSIRRILCDVICSNPLTFGLNRIHVSFDEKGTIIDFEYYPECDSWKNDVRNRVEEMYDELSIADCGTDLEIELAVNDWMCENCTYCKEMDFHIKHSVLGILLEKRGVCSSFALCTSLLLSSFGVECYAIGGRLKNSNDKDFFSGIRPSECMDELLDVGELDSKYELTTYRPDEPKKFRKEMGFEEYDREDFVGHAWNYVFIEGRGRHLDVTFDNGYHRSPSGRDKHSFFNLTSEEINEDRIIFFGPGSIRR